MAHPLLAPALAPFGRPFWTRIRVFSIGRSAQPESVAAPVAHPAPVLAVEAIRLDARGRQRFLRAVLKARPIAN